MGGYYNVLYVELPAFAILQNIINGLLKGATDFELQVSCWIAALVAGMLANQIMKLC